MRFHVIILSLLLLAAACKEDKVMTFEEDLTHRNGLMTTLPVGFTHVLNREGFVLTEAGNLRSPRVISVALANKDPKLSGAEMRELDSGQVYFTVEELSSGSGGTEYRLDLVQPVGTHFVVLTAIEQREIGRPDFAVAWEVLNRTRVN